MARGQDIEDRLIAFAVRIVTICPVHGRGIISQGSCCAAALHLRPIMPKPEMQRAIEILFTK